MGADEMTGALWRRQGHRRTECEWLAFEDVMGRTASG
jgi:hypothetical protein